MPTPEPTREQAEALADAIRSELQPVYHVTPGGLKWSRSTDALRELLAAVSLLVTERDELRATLDNIGRFASSHSGRDGQDVLLAAVYRIAEECEQATSREALAGGGRTPPGQDLGGGTAAVVAQVSERIRKEIEWYETFGVGGEHASLVQTLREALDALTTATVSPPEPAITYEGLKALHTEMLIETPYDESEVETRGTPFKLASRPPDPVPGAADVTEAGE